MTTSMSAKPNVINDEAAVLPRKMVEGLSTGTVIATGPVHVSAL
jgi:hypothetical protein